MSDNSNEELMIKDAISSFRSDFINAFKSGNVFYYEGKKKVDVRKRRKRLFPVNVYIDEDKYGCVFICVEGCDGNRYSILYSQIGSDFDSSIHRPIFNIPDYEDWIYNHLEDLNIEFDENDIDSQLKYQEEYEYYVKEEEEKQNECPVEWEFDETYALIILSGYDWSDYEWHND